MLLASFVYLSIYLSIWNRNFTFRFRWCSIFSSYVHMLVHCNHGNECLAMITNIIISIFNHKLKLNSIWLQSRVDFPVKKKPISTNWIFVLNRIENIGYRKFWICWTGSNHRISFGWLLIDIVSCQKHEKSSDVTQLMLTMARWWSHSHRITLNVTATKCCNLQPFQLIQNHFLPLE